MHIIKNFFQKNKKQTKLNNITYIPDCKNRGINKEELMTKLMEIRKEKNLSIEEISKSIGIKPTTVESIENNKLTPSLQIITKYSELLGFEISYNLIEKE